ncbi:hypothetical protein [Roseateles sp.]|uniref:hypothetical protein n=1 Tax=Roseateles sp. TaxID=1971397 RepID=UPI0031DCBEBA
MGLGSAVTGSKRGANPVARAAEQGGQDSFALLRHLEQLALAVRGRTDVWLMPARIARSVDEVLSSTASPAVRLALATVLGRAAKGAGGASSAIPRWLSTQVQRHLAEFDRLYALARRESTLYAMPLMLARQNEWGGLLGELEKAGVSREAAEVLDRYLAVRMNHVMASGGALDDPLRKAVLPATGSTGNAASRAAQGATGATPGEMVDAMARTERQTKNMDAATRARLPWEQLGPLGKLERLLPPGDPAWRQIDEWVALRRAAGQPVVGAQLQGYIGELVALRTAGVVEFLRDEARRVLAQDPSLGGQGWRLVIQQRPVTMAQAGKDLRKGGALPATGLGGNGESFDLSVWLVKDAEDGAVAMPVVRVQVKSGQEANAVGGVTQSLDSDEWRMFSDTVTLDVGTPGAPVAKNFELRPPDTFSVVRVLVTAGDADPGRLAKAVPPGGDLTLFRMPFTGSEFNAIGQGLARRLGGQ